ncbi:hypothetical protein [Thermogemmatispora tikiterensis]|uniref:hypothetical protein n=1 Tax=Thermogemmatispora tikiterensis TaxID=1825093 RepID=UPI001CB93239|nr:hypothetical protein [Thermogemmatispora tikiterensis]
MVRSTAFTRRINGNALMAQATGPIAGGFVANLPKFDIIVMGDVGIPHPGNSLLGRYSAAVDSDDGDGFYWRTTCMKRKRSTVTGSASVSPGSIVLLG